MEYNLGAFLVLYVASYKDSLPLTVSLFEILLILCGAWYLSLQLPGTGLRSWVFVWALLLEVEISK